MNPMLLMLLAISAGMMFFSVRGQKKQQEQRLNMLNSMKPGDKVVTIGGLYGVVDSIDTDVNTVTLDIDGVYLTFERAAIRTVIAGDAPVETVEIETAEVVEETDSAIEE